MDNNITFILCKLIEVAGNCFICWLVVNTILKNWQK